MAQGQGQGQGRGNNVNKHARARAAEQPLSGPSNVTRQASSRPGATHIVGNVPVPTEVTNRPSRRG